MEVFADYLARIDNQEHRERTEEVLAWVAKKYPNLKPVIKWNQPMFTDHGTFIIGFSVSKNRMTVSPELQGIVHFSDEIVQAGYRHTKYLVIFPWEKPFDFSLLQKMIEFNIWDKSNCSTFWRK
ncbi:iron chaperone [Heyndrickxia ginsengihumi]|mgnify:CR=1 FL=1|uniref:Iron chaperone n=1 Tax=Heyndrickxia ginsengihumi TaxID=363870 RepID=A0A0A6VFL7_9BACI|nr:iron chaperone [Heyndrickxia ginsengihumi]KHD86238.1 iron chaperone [Heyndrickxia ginsengihumi]MBE6184787.1 iron chaperone [Bacillus sp. (in: firmicutes)]NEY20242.1 iron chaperone [Heyndrickxia ginsengihumi]